MPKKDREPHKEEWCEVDINIEGTGLGLLQNKIRPDTIDELLKKQLGLPKGPKRQYTLDEYARLGTHPLATPTNGAEYGHPGYAFWAAMRDAAHKDSGIPKSTAAQNIRVVTGEDGLVPLNTPDGWDIDLRPSKNKKTTGGSSAVVVIRPRFPRWSATLTIRFNQNAGLTPERIVALLDAAGSRVGVGSFPISVGGPFGGFRVVTKPYGERRMSMTESTQSTP